MLLPEKIRNLRFSNCWKCTEVINPTITNVIFVSFKIFYDPIRRTFLAPGGRHAHSTHPTPPPPCLRAWPAVYSVKRGKVFVIQTLDKVDSAVRVTLLPGTTFLLINLPIFQKIGRSTQTQRSKFGRSFLQFGQNRWLVVILSSVTRCGRNNKQCVCY